MALPYPASCWPKTRNSSSDFCAAWPRAESLRGAIATRPSSLISKRDPSPLDAIKVDYDVTKASMTEDGSLPDDVLRDEVATRAELTKVAVANRPNPSALFDYSITRRNYAQLKAAGWQPAR